MSRLSRTKTQKRIILGGLVLFFCLFTPLVFAAAPTLGTITPSSGSSTPNTAKTFTCTYSDADGWTNLKEVYLLISTSSTTLTNSVYLYYDQNTNLLYLRNNANTAWLGGYAPGSSNVIENSQVKLNCASTTVSGSSNTLTVNWSVTFKATYSGKTYSTYLKVKDDTGGSAGWTKKGTWTVNYSPLVGTITPSSGTSNPEQAITFTTTYIDADGWQNIQYVHLQINTSTNGKNCFYGYYNQNTNKLYLRNNVNTAWLGGYAPGTTKVIENSYAKLDCSKTNVSGSSNTLTVKWSVTFKPTFTGTKNSYLYVKDDTGAYNDWVKKGTWTINPILSISVNPKLWDIGSTEVNKIITMTSTQKIAVTNDGTGPETLELKLTNPPGWTASTSPGNETYVLSGLFCNTTDIPQANSFNQDATNEDVITIQPKKATQTIFAYKTATANGVAIPQGNKRSLYLQFKSPTITQKREEQNISVIVSCQIP